MRMLLNIFVKQNSLFRCWPSGTEIKLATVGEPTPNEKSIKNTKKFVIMDQFLSSKASSSSSISVNPTQKEIVYLLCERYGEE